MRTLFLHSCSTLPSSHPWRSILPTHSSRFRFSFPTAHYRPWDSNAESFSSKNFSPADQDEEDDPAIRFRTTRNKRRRWWSDDDPPLEFDGQPSGIFDAVIDSVWIFKVFKSYGWALPPIILSLLLNSGPKAFLMALALPLGQSMISLALEKLWGASERRPKRRTKSKTRKRPFYSTESRVQEKEPANGNGEGNGKMGYGYQSWEVDTNGDEVIKEAKSGTSFGGWEDLDGVGYERKGKSRVRGKRQSSSSSMEKGKLSWREKKSDTPLLLRLLIAVFPFLGSWTRML